MKITHDFHIHTNLSLCANETATVENYIKIAKKIGLTKLGFSNHFRMFKLAKEAGCKFVFGSDAHNKSQHSSYGNAQFIANLLELKEDDIAEIARND